MQPSPDNSTTHKKKIRTYPRTRPTPNLPNTLKITFLGTSTSVGIPVIGCDCTTCTSTDPKNKRLRSSIHIHTPTHSILIDAGPDLRQQALRHNLTKVDAVLYTHNHLDHVTGFDELRAFCWRRKNPLPLYGTQETLDSLKTMFAWAFSDSNTYKGYIQPDPIPVASPFLLGETTITPLPVTHGSVETIGYLIEHPHQPSLAYIPDVKTIPQTTLDLLENIDILIIDALRPQPHPTHLSIPESVQIAKSINAKKTYLTHISHETDYVEEQKNLPQNITFAYDTLQLP